MRTNSNIHHPKISAIHLLNLVEKSWMSETSSDTEEFKFGILASAQYSISDHAKYNITMLILRRVLTPDATDKQNMKE